MVWEAAYALAEFTDEHYSDEERLFPELSRLRDASEHVAASVMSRAFADGVATVEPVEDANLQTYVHERTWQPDYLPVRLADNDERKF
jgi:malate dehydrogenase (oxaloacetate-decarboxylating)